VICGYSSDLDDISCAGGRSKPRAHCFCSRNDFSCREPLFFRVSLLVRFHLRKLVLRASALPKRSMVSIQTIDIEDPLEC
jgi:hypothetical protein